MSPPALAILELSSIARGVVCSDAVVKRAPVELLQSRPVSSGKHLVVFAGEVAEVDESRAAGIEIAGDALVDALFLPMADAQLAPLLSDTPPAPPATDDAVAVVETRTVCAAVAAADAAAKAADVVLLQMRLAVGIGGKAFFTMTGELHSIEAAADAARTAAGANVLGIEIVPRPHADLTGGLIK